MVNTALSWQQAAVLTLVLAGVTAAAGGFTERAARCSAGLASFLNGVVPFLRESALITALYALWQYAGAHARANTGGAYQRGRDVLNVERVLHLPAEAALQRPVLAHPLLLQALNVYYDTAHFTVMLIFLAWLFLRHRRHYPAVRNVLVLTTALCLLLQLVPVAPPRLLPGFVDTAAVYGQSVYSAFGVSADQLSAMPSVHVAWALIVGLGVVYATTGPWRWLALGYPLLTGYAVVVTANHYWLDGIVAAALVTLVTAAYAVAVASVHRRGTAGAGHGPPVGVGADLGRY